MDAIGKNGRQTLAATTAMMFPKLDEAVMRMYFDMFTNVLRPSRMPSSRTPRSLCSRIDVYKRQEQQLALVRAYVKDNFVDKGMCADFAIHDKGTGNPHVHIMLTVRPLKKNGAWGAKLSLIHI